MLTNATVFAVFLFLMHSVSAFAAVHAVPTTRTSQGVVAWTISLVTLPEFTLIPCLIFGWSILAGYVDARRSRNACLREVTLSDN